MSKNLGVKMPIIVVLTLAIVVLGLVGVVTYAKPNPKALGLIHEQQINDNNGIGNGKGLTMQKMFNNIRKLPLGWGLWLNKKFIEVSEGFKDKVVSMLKENENTSKLLDEGYNVTAIRPIIKLIVQDEGTVALKAVGAWISLYKEGEGVVHVLVDLENSKVVNVWGPVTCSCLYR